MVMHARQPFIDFLRWRKLGMWYCVCSRHRGRPFPHVCLQQKPHQPLSSHRVDICHLAWRCFLICRDRTPIKRSGLISGKRFRHLIAALRIISRSLKGQLDWISHLERSHDLGFSARKWAKTLELERGQHSGEVAGDLYVV